MSGWLAFWAYGHMRELHPGERQASKIRIDRQYEGCIWTGGCGGNRPKRLTHSGAARLVDLVRVHLIRSDAVRLRSDPIQPAFGAGEGIRTLDPHVGNVMLYP